jgi:CheY-like chemotaxis protein
MSTVLVVEDEPTVRDVVVRYLRQAGYDAVEACDLDEAVARRASSSST